MPNETQICNDWGNEFPCLGRYKQGRKLLRVFDPVVLGIELEKFSNDAYRPRFVALNLLSSFPEFAISRTLITERRPQLPVTYSDHLNKYREAADIMRNSFPILSSKTGSHDDMLIAVYRSEIEATLSEFASPLAIWFSLIQILNFYEREEEAIEERNRLDDYVKTLPPSSLVVFDDFGELMRRELGVSVAELMSRKINNISKGSWNILPNT